MNITLQGNTSKETKFFPATNDMPAMLYMDVADKIVKRDGSTTTVWYKVKVAYNYAVTLSKQIKEGISRRVFVEGEVIDAPKIFNDKAKTTIWAKKITWLDDKYPKTEAPADNPANETELGTTDVTSESATEVDDLDCPW